MEIEIWTKELGVWDDSVGVGVLNGRCIVRLAGFRDLEPEFEWDRCAFGKPIVINENGFRQTASEATEKECMNIKEPSGGVDTGTRGGGFGGGGCCTVEVVARRKSHFLCRDTRSSEWLPALADYWANSVIHHTHS